MNRTVVEEVVVQDLTKLRVVLAASTPLHHQDVLDGVIVASLGLMAAVAWHLARIAITDVPSALLAIAAAVLLVTARPNSTWLILGGAGAGWMLGG